MHCNIDRNSKVYVLLEHILTREFPCPSPCRPGQQRANRRAVSDNHPFMPEGLLRPGCMRRLSVWSIVTAVVTADARFNVNYAKLIAAISA